MKKRQTSKFDSFYFEITVVFRTFAGEFQHAVVGIGNSLFVVKSVAEFPNGIFRFLIGADRHFTRYGNSLILKPSALVKIHASLIICQVLLNFFRRRIRRKIHFASFYSSRSKHSPYYGVPLLVDGRKKRGFLF